MSDSKLRVLIPAERIQPALLLPVFFPAGLDQRDRAQRALGPRFDLRRFHHAVLRNGAIPLTVLDDEITRWITVQAATEA